MAAAPWEGTFWKCGYLQKLRHTGLINLKNSPEVIKRNISNANCTLHSAFRKALIVAIHFERENLSLFPQKRIWYRHYSFSASQQQHLENYLTFLFLSVCIQITNNVQHAVTKPLM